MLLLIKKYRRLVMLKQLLKKKILDLSIKLNSNRQIILLRTVILRLQNAKLKKLLIIRKGMVRKFRKIFYH
ncbi:hypothetical protein CFY87_04285 [Actinobacillus seminis]|uniref:Uncharacterized protein n=1 Tax=Actinobacillus seminis TaxID=722 RepID=A0ABX4FSJ0_9PAST|nr:hypothetical protein CFY87_04285 [Actinobacillus seminis]